MSFVLPLETDSVSKSFKSRAPHLSPSFLSGNVAKSVGFREDLCLLQPPSPHIPPRRVQT
jgi:hypothetical protein